MINLQYAYLYLDGAALWIAVAMFCILLLSFIFMGTCYLAAERKADKLLIKNRRLRADLKVAEMELKSVELKGSVTIPPPQAVPLPLGQGRKEACPYKVEPERTVEDGKVFD